MVGKSNIDRAHHLPAEIEEELDDERMHSMADEGGFTAAEAETEEEEIVMPSQVVRPPNTNAAEATKKPDPDVIPASRETSSTTAPEPQKLRRLPKLTEPQLSIALIAVSGVAVISILGWALERRARRYSEEVRDMAA